MQKAITGANGTPEANIAAINGMTPHYMNESFMCPILQLKW